ncbi:MAG: arsenite methyltransferase [Solirubrobacteraceae bacterium]
MAELTVADTTTDRCCAPEQQATCCEPGAKADCCGHDEGCGCDAGSTTGSTTTPADDLREQVRERYAAAATHVTSSTDPGPGCCAPSDAFDGGSEVFGAALYALSDHEQLPDTAKLASLGCGNTTAVAEMHDGETVLDLGSGGGIDVLLSAKRVGPTGKAHGLDMTDEMLALARENARKAGVENVEFHKGYIEEIPLPDASVDVVISNCVINLSGDKRRVLREVARVLRPGGRFAVSDVIADESMDDATRADMQQWTGCIAGALTRREFTSALADAGLTDIEIRETHRVHPQAASAIVRARKPTERPA